MNRRKVWLYVFATLAILQMLLIFMLSAQPAPESSNTSASFIETVARLLHFGFDDLTAVQQQTIIESWHTAVRKMAHFGIYSGLGFCLLGTAYCSRGIKFFKRALIAKLVGLLYAISDEVHQIFVPGRGPQITDAILDFMGVLFGGAVFLAALGIIKQFLTVRNKSKLNKHKNNNTAR